MPASAFGRSEVLLLGGRSGVGKTSVGYAASEKLQAARVAHCLIDGDNLDAAFPKPVTDVHGTALTEANLVALWGNYAALGYHRLIYVNTVSVLERAMIVRAMGGAGRVFGVLLTATDDTVAVRLAARETGRSLAMHLQRSRTRAADLDSRAAAWVLRVPSDGRSVDEVAAQVLAATSWLR